jgi:hypothetical protein
MWVNRHLYSKTDTNDKNVTHDREYSGVSEKNTMMNP